MLQELQTNALKVKTERSNTVLRLVIYKSIDARFISVLFGQQEYCNPSTLICSLLTRLLRLI